MPTRAAGSSPSPWMAATISPVSPPRTARRSRICSCSVDISVQLFGMTRLVQQDLKRRKVGVPFDQRGHGAEAPERRGVKPPDRLCDPGTVVVDQDTHVLGNAMAGEMDLADRLDRQCLKIGKRIEPEIPRADMDVVDVAEDAAAGSMGDFRHKLRLRNRGMPVAEVGGRVLDQ